MAETFQWWMLPCIWLAAWSGDLTSYTIGYFKGNQCQQVVLNKFPQAARHHNKALGHLDKYGCFAIFIGRFLGPVSWFLPFLAGCNQFSIYRFGIASLAGCMFATAQFIVIGFMISYSPSFIAQFL